MNAVNDKEVRQTTDGGKENTGNDNGVAHLPKVLTVDEVAALLRVNRSQKGRRNNSRAHGRGGKLAC